MIRGLLTNTGSAILATLLALMVWFVAINENNPPREGEFPPGATIEIEAINLPPGLLMYDPIRQGAQVRLLAPTRLWEQLRPTDFHAFVDLQGLDPGIHEVPVKVVCARCAENRARIVSYSPQKVSVRLEERTSRTLDVQIDLIGDAHIGFSLQRPVVQPATVTVVGPRTAVDAVNQVKGRLFLNAPRAALERSATVFALNKDGGEVSRVQLEPREVNVRVPVEQEQGYKVLAVSVQRDIVPADGYWVSNITVTPSTVTVNGPPDAFANVKGFLQTQPIVATDAKQSFERSVPLLVPEGLTLVEPREPSVLVRVEVEVERSGRTIERIPERRNVPPGLQASISPPSVQLILSGPIPDLRKVNPDRDVSVFVDLAGLTAGVHTVTPQARIGIDNIERRFVPDKVEVTLTAPTPVPSPTTPP